MRSKMNKQFSLATKRISAVAMSAVLLSSTVVGTPFGNYLDNSVEDNRFIGEVVVGSDAAASDTTAATNIIDFLSDEFSEERHDVRITYQKEEVDGEEIRIVDRRSDEHYLGGSLGEVRSNEFDDLDLNVLDNGHFSVDSDREDLIQEIRFHDNGYFEHSLRTRIEDEMSQKLFFDRREPIMTYSFELDNFLNFTGGDYDEDDVLGSEFRILGSTYTVGDYSMSNGVFDELKLLGGANRVALGAGESSTVTIDGLEYEVRVIDVSDADRVVVEVNGERRTISLYDSRSIGGVEVSVLDTFSSGRSAFAELLVGGEEILLRDGREVRLGGEDISDLYDDYEVITNFVVEDDLFGGIEFVYSYTGSNGLALYPGDVFEDRLFGVLSIYFEGTNDPDYVEVEFDVSGMDLSLFGETVRGQDFSRDIAYGVEYEINGDDERAGLSLVGDSRYVPHLIESLSLLDGNGDYRYVVVDLENRVNGAPMNVTNVDLSDNNAYAIVDYDAVFNNSQRGVLFVAEGRDIKDMFRLDETTNVVGYTNNNTDIVAVTGIEASEAAAEGLSLLTGDLDTQQWYIIDGFDEDGSRTEFSFTNYFTDSSRDLRLDRITNLDDVTGFGYDEDEELITSIEFNSEHLAMANELLVNLSGVNVYDFERGESVIILSYDGSDIDYEEPENGVLELGMGDGNYEFLEIGIRYSSSDNELRLHIDDSAFVEYRASGARNEVTPRSDTRQELDLYGSIVTWDTDSRDRVSIMVPDEQLVANVYLLAGEVREQNSIVVDSRDVEAEKERLQDEGYTIVDEERLDRESVEFDITSPLLDTDVDSEDGNFIVVGGPAVNMVARDLLGIDSYDVDNPEDVSDKAGVSPGEGIAIYFEDSNSVLIYGYSAEDTTEVVERVIAGEADFETR